LGGVTALFQNAGFVIDVDGDHHGYSDRQWDHDHGRDTRLVDQGYKIIRVWNSDIRRDLDAVTIPIEHAVQLK
jgi:very-short-patch-repair endonuclease